VFCCPKEKYKKVTNKQEYMDLETDEAATVQEIYYCDQYEVRKAEQVIAAKKKILTPVIK
jgi:hypothetical protein